MQPSLSQARPLLHTAAGNRLTPMPLNHASLGQDQMLPNLPPLISPSGTTGTPQIPSYSELDSLSRAERRDTYNNDAMSNHEIHLAALEGEKSSTMKKLVRYPAN